ncbi:uncharacterized protein Bfra_010872 [Botrytis fragariae]|uniref:Uncharacterized protein n=1 Tax=Botrytis fragariae TaxID=1964551 RepID=A0A8H6ALY0_9HELO|nr:uncharacterized protein Bfra_010872 [Botrytis fragariae]KAF5869675.1 hypothetical protein Bfra_010872 [Botrytis fragariae]
MCDFGIPFVCIQCGTDQNPCHVKIVGPTLGFGVGVLSALVCWPASLFVGCCATELLVLPHPSITHLSQANVEMMTTNNSAHIRMLGAPVDINGQVSNAIPF